MILATLRHLARALGCRDDQAEDVLRSEASARATLSRRAALGLGAAAIGAAASGGSFSFGSVDHTAWNVYMNRIAAVDAQIEAILSMHARPIVSVFPVRSGMTITSALYAIWETNGRPGDAAD